MISRESHPLVEGCLEASSNRLYAGVQRGVIVFTLTILKQVLCVRCAGIGSGEFWSAISAVCASRDRNERFRETLWLWEPSRTPGVDPLTGSETRVCVWGGCKGLIELALTVADGLGSNRHTRAERRLDDEWSILESNQGPRQSFSF